MQNLFLQNLLDKSLPCRLITVSLLQIEGLGVTGPVGQLGLEHLLKLGHRVGMDDMGDLLLLHGHMCAWRRG